MSGYFQSKFNKALDHIASSLAQRITSAQNFSAIQPAALQRLSPPKVPTKPAPSKSVTPLCISEDTTHFYIHTSDGHRFFLDAKDLHISLHVLEHGCWEDHIRSAMMKIIRPGSTFIDVGANVGLHTLFASSIVGPTGQVHAFEPLPHLFKTLNLNVNVNGAGGIVKTYQLAVSDREGIARFSNFRTHSAMSGFTVPAERLSLHNQTEESIDTIEVMTTTLDAMFSDREVDGLKVDVEGYEGLVLAGAKAIIRDNHNIKLILEWDPPLVKRTMGNESLHETISYLRSENFIAYHSLWQKPLRSIAWDEAASVQGDLVLSRTPLSN
ncbi:MULTISPECIES: FkbM family methyltransferase [Rhizobium]|uniref:FkbM family methyltransferase n=1 Tax=Rhizobium paranaense TaxID=1650438 RepID=A0A7W8XYK4_9HYPH|nr:FkbM family methyltransferase [Rhizobium paranaense]MBB5577958.1 FkbM family methyltransferase [Rhizobium paranaense]